ncbi:MAG: hypothetical protein ACJAUZ_003144, partial [Flavobacteriaceae bacterium]
MLSRVARFARIEHVLVKYGLEKLFLDQTSVSGLQHLFILSPTRWLSAKTRDLPRGV